MSAGFTGLGAALLFFGRYTRARRSQGRLTRLRKTRVARVDLKVPFAEKDEAKALGARWGSTGKSLVRARGQRNGANLETASVRSGAR